MFQRIFSLGFKVMDLIILKILTFFEQLLSHIIFFGQGVRYHDFKTSGIPFVSVARSGSCKIGHGFKMNSGIKGNPVGPSQRSIIFVAPNAQLSIGNKVGISQTAIICFEKITIGNNVKIGGGVCIYDTDFHSLNVKYRIDGKNDEKHTITKPVEVKDNAFIGAHSTILKGITIGKNSIVGACSVVTRSIPDNEIWAGNPAKLIKKLVSENEIELSYAHSI